MKKLILILSLISSQLFAQSGKSDYTFEIEVDPMAYIMKGYSLHGAYQPGRWRFDAAVYGIEVPESFHKNVGFNVFNQGFGLKAHYLINGTRGLFSGVGVGYGTVKATHIESNISNVGHNISIAPEIGYRIFLKKPNNGNNRGFYLAPWVSYGYNIITDKVQFASEDFKQTKWQFFPTIHIGYRL